MIIIYQKKGLQMYVSLTVYGGLMEIQTPAPILMNFYIHIPTCPGGAGLTPTPSPIWAWGPEILTHFWKLFNKTKDVQQVAN